MQAGGRERTIRNEIKTMAAPAAAAAPPAVRCAALLQLYIAAYQSVVA